MFQKLFTGEQIRAIDRLTIERQNISSEELMERAATKLFHHLLPHVDQKTPVYIFCGKGNNGGDALVLTRLLYLHNYDVKCFTIGNSQNASPDFKTNLKKLEQIGFKVINIQEDNFPTINSQSIIIDGIFGTGLSRPVHGLAQKIIEYINQSGAKIISIDMPSGMYADTSNQPDDTIVKADTVFSFQFPKISFFFPENSQFISDFEIIDIGLDSKVMAQLPSNYWLLNDEVLKIRKKRPSIGHKNTFGHAYIIGGSNGMMGAPLLSSHAALRIGAGLVTNFLPKKGYKISQTYLPEVMTLTDKNKNHITDIKLPRRITAVGIGMGMQTNEKTQKAFKKFLKTIKVPLLLDADALNILSLHKNWWQYIPENSILTPHEGEFKRLTGNWQNDTEKWQLLQKLASRIKSTVVLKGAYTTISDGNHIYINPVANSALATAGSGDVLSGIITGLLAQGYQTLEACLLGVYIHGQTAEKYKKNHAPYSMTATDIIEQLKYY